MVLPATAMEIAAVTITTVKDRVEEEEEQLELTLQLKQRHPVQTQMFYQKINHPIFQALQMEKDLVLQQIQPAERTKNVAQPKQAKVGKSHHPKMMIQMKILMSPCTVLAIEYLLEK